MLLDDRHSVGVVFDLKPIGTEGRSEEYLSRIRGVVKDAIQDSFDELDTYPYVVQFYCQDEKDLRSYVEQLKDYIAPEIQATAFTQEWLENTEKNLKDISKPGGLFVDDQITNTIWAGRIRRTRMVIYRYVEKNEEHSAIESLNNACERIVGALTTAGLQLTRQNGDSLVNWNFLPNDRDDLIMSFVLGMMFLILPGVWIASMSWAGFNLGSIAKGSQQLQGSSSNGTEIIQSTTPLPKTKLR